MPKKKVLRYDIKMKNSRYFWLVKWNPRKSYYNSAFFQFASEWYLRHIYEQSIIYLQFFFVSIDWMTYCDVKMYNVQIKSAVLEYRRWQWFKVWWWWGSWSCNGNDGTRSLFIYYLVSCSHYLKVAQYCLACA